MRGDHRFDSFRLGKIEQEARIDRGRIRHDPQPQAGGTAAVGHRLTHVDRQNPAGLAQSIVGRSQAGQVQAIVIPAEATRAKKEYWKSGFRRIAADAGIPICLTFLDGPTRTGGFGPIFHPTDDVVADMDRIREFYDDKHGRNTPMFRSVRCS